MSLMERVTETLAAGRLHGRLAEALPDRPQRRQLLAQLRSISKNVACPHNESHLLSFVVPLLEMSDDVEGVIVEAGCFKGGSTAKLSLVASLLGRRLVVFDSFQGLPANDEAHESSVLGYSIEGWFAEGEFCGTLDEVRNNVEAYGDSSVVDFVPGWFDDTMPSFDQPICGAYVDVDLADSTRSCLKYLYPRLSPGGVLVSQDGDFPLVIEVYENDEFWEREIGSSRPPIHGLGTKKILTIVKQPA